MYYLKIINFLTSFKLDRVLKITILFSYFITKQIIFLFGNFQESPDFDRYFSYIEFFYNDEEFTNRDQGIFFYYLNSLVFYLVNNFFEYLTFTDLLITIHFINELLFIVGLIGIYKLLKILNFKETDILLLTIFLIYLPLSFELRMTFKSEIMAFSFLPWILFSFEKYHSSSEKKYLLAIFPLLITLTSLKVFIATQILLLLIISQLKVVRKLGIKKSLVYIISFLIFFSIISFENYQANGRSVFNLQSGANDSENYNYKAPINILWKFEGYKLISEPVKNTHANSFLSIFLLDFNGDYFDIHWDNNSSFFAKDRIDLLTFSESKELKIPKINTADRTLTYFLQSNTDIYLRKLLGLFMSLSIVTLWVLTFLNDKNYRVYSSSFVIGLTLVLIHVILGFPNNNFDPQVGDTLKPYYSSFLITLAIVFTLIKYFSKKRFIKFIFVLMFSLISIYNMGFPKNYSPETTRLLNERNSNSIVCEVNNVFFNFDQKFNEDTCVKRQVSNKEGAKKSLPSIKFPKFQIFNFSLVFLNLFSLIWISKFSSEKFNKK